MKSLILLLAAVATFLTSTALRANDFWYGSVNSTWDTTALNWWNPDNTSQFHSGDNVIFEYSWAPLTVTIAGTGVTAGGMIFDVNGYTITGGTLSLNGSWPELNASSGVTATIASFVNASGSGQTLEQYRTGTLIFAGGGNIGYHSINEGGTLVLAGGPFSIGGIGLSANAALKVTGAAVATSNAYQLLSSGAYNYLGITGGSWTGAALRQGDNPADTGVITQSGGSFIQNTGNPFVLGGWNAAGGTGVFNLDGGTMNVNAPMSIGWDTNTSGHGEVNINAGLATATEFDFRGTTSGALNLRGGTFSVATIQAQSSWGYNDANATGSVNFNGGTLQAAQDGATLINLQTAGTENNVFIYPGGATIDTHGRNVTLANGFNPPGGSGVSGIALVNGGSGYNGEPYVQITGGGGTGATARAPIDSNGAITGIVVTNPGTGYTGAPSAALVGGTNSGGTTTNATLGAVSTAANGTGSFTKAGAGTLTLSGTSRLQGNSFITGGVLDITGYLYDPNTWMPAWVMVDSGATLRLHSWGYAYDGLGQLSSGNNLDINGGTIEMADNGGGGRGFGIDTGGATLLVDAGVTWSLGTWPTPSVTNNSSLILDGSGTGDIQMSINGTGSVTKQGTGTWTLSGSNTYAGATIVTAGTLIVNGGISNSSAMTVAAGAGLTANSGIGITGTVTLAQGCALNFGLGGVGASGIIKITGTYAAPSSPVQVNISALNYNISSGTYNLITGAAGISTGNFVLGSTPPGAYTLSASNGTLSVTVVLPPSAPTSVLGTSGTIGAAYSYQLPAAGNPTGYGASNLPPGLSLNSSTGLISGTPTDQGTYYTTISSTGAEGTGSTQLIFVLPPPEGTPLLTGSKSPQVVLDSGTSLTVQPWRDNTLLINPGKGFVEYYNPSSYTSKWTGIGYCRWHWADFEPSEGVYDWSLINNSIASWAAYGLKFSFGIINSDEYAEYETPQWVFQPGSNPQTGSVYPAGAVPLSVVCPNNQTTIVPSSWNDPVYLARMHEFITAFGAQFNGNPNIGFLDMRNYGLWGEGNGSFAAGLANLPPEDLLANYYMPYVQAFPDTQLIEDAWYSSVGATLCSLGTGARLDGIMSGSGNGSPCLLAYPNHPAVMEYYGLPASGYRGGAENELLIYVTGGRPSYMQLDTIFCDNDPNFYQMAGNLIGYHFVLQQATIPKSIQAGAAFPLSLTWLNDGVAPLYEPCSVAAALLDANNNVVLKQWLTSSNPHGWMPGVSATENFNVTFPSVPVGCKLALGLFSNQTDSYPAYKLGIQGRIISGWYILSGSTAPAVALPSPWAKADVGTVGTTGTSVYIGKNAFHLEGAGSGIAGSADSFQFSYVTTTSNSISLIARVTPPISGSTEVGLIMRRDATTAGARMAALILKPNGAGYQAQFGSRTSTGGSITWATAVTGLAVPQWLKLTRSGATGNVYTGYVSSNGNTWTQVGTRTTTSIIANGATACAGLLVSSLSTGSLATETFDNVSAPGWTPAPVITSGASVTGSTGGALSYQITAANSPASYAASGLPAGLSVNTGTGLINGTPSVSGTFIAAVSAINSGGTGSAILTLTVSPQPPAAPTGLSATGGNHQVSLSWDASLGATGYNVKRSLVSGSGYSILAANTAATSYTDSGASNWIPYYYVVSALNAGGEGPNSLQAAATPQSPAISPAEQYVSTTLSMAGGTATVTFAASVVGHTYQLQYSDLLTAGTWVNCGAALPGTGGDLVFAAPYDNTQPRKFYRIQIRQ
jgi:autotransporter-associated beta strand protein